MFNEVKGPNEPNQIDFDNDSSSKIMKYIACFAYWSKGQLVQAFSGIFWIHLTPSEKRE